MIRKLDTVRKASGNFQCFQTKKKKKTITTLPFSRFILEVGKTMNLYHLTMATGAVYFHRFYMFHAFQDFPRYLVATCCLFLAGKAEETPKKCKDIVRVVRSLTNDRQYATFGADPREEVMILERVLLQTIKFDLQVDHPYGSIIKFAKSLKGDSAKLEKVVQMSWTFVNDSLCTTLCLRWEPEIIAIAVMHLAVKLSKFEIKDWANRQESHNDWWDQFVDNLDTSDLEDICHQVLDLYGEPPTSAKDKADSPPPTTKPQRQKSKPPLPPQPQRTTPPPPKSRPQTPPPMPPGGSAPPAPGKPPLPSSGPPLPMSQAGQYPAPPNGAGQYPPPPGAHPPPPQGYPPPGNPPPPASYSSYPPSGGYRPQGGYMPHPNGPPSGHYQAQPGYYPPPGQPPYYQGGPPPPGPPGGYPPPPQHSRY